MTPEAQFIVAIGIAFMCVLLGVAANAWAVGRALVQLQQATRTRDDE